MAIVLPGNIIYGGPMAVTAAVNSRSLGEYSLEQLRRHGDNVLLIDAVSGKEFTSRLLLKSVTRLAATLQGLGVERGDVVCICSENRIEFAIALFATLAAGAAFAPLSVSYTDNEVEHALNLSKPKIVFASGFALKQIMRVTTKTAFVKTVVAFDKIAAVSSRAHYLRDLLSAESKAETNFVPPNINKEDDVAVIVCSSGTTGLPKGVQLTHYNILALIDAQHHTTDTPNEFVLLTVIPWFHAFGCLTLLTTMCSGMRLVYLEKFEEKLFLESIQKYRVILSFMVPPLMVFLAKHPIVDNYDLSSLMFLVCGAAPLSEETVEEVKRRIGVPFVRQGYGLSESTLSVLVQNDDYCKAGSVGTVRYGTYANVIDPDTGKVLGPNQRGELCFKGPTIMKGYIGDSSSTQSMIRDGWLHTGDIGYYDSNLEFYIVDRIKELIKYKAFQVPPAELEAILLTHHKIRDAAVIGKPDEVAGELPMAFVVRQDKTELSEEEVVQYVAERTSNPKRLRGGVQFVNEIPKNPSGKILRRVLRDRLVVKSKL